MEYKLSLWGERGKKHIESNVVTNEWREEYRICNIASSTLINGIGAYDIELTEKVNGEKSLTFSIQYKYFDITDNQYKDNPYLSLLVNERVVKLEYEDKIEPFVIDQIDKSSDKKSISVKCSYLVYKELSKNGYNITLDTELENNMGTAFELAETIMDGTEWQVIGNIDHTPHSELIKGYVNEPLYIYTVPDNKTIQLTNLDGGTGTTAPSGAIIYISANSYDQEKLQPQCYYVSGGNYITDEEGIIKNSPHYEFANALESALTGLYISASYRGKSLTSTAKTKYLTSIDKYCNIYTKNSIEYYGFDKYEYLSSSAIQDLLKSTFSLTDIKGWTASGCTLSSVYDTTNHIYILQNTGNGTITNIGLTDAIAGFEEEGFSSKIDYVLRLKLVGNSNTITSANITGIQVSSGSSSPVTYHQGNFSISGNYAEATLHTTNELSYSDLLNHTLRLNIVLGNAKISEIKLFKKKTYNGSIIYPDETTLNSDILNHQLYLFNKSNYDTNDDAGRISSINDIKYSDIVDYSSNDYQLQYKTGYELVTSISASQSNRFNLIQDICEKFECWSRFTIGTNANGRTKYKYTTTSDTVYKPGKQYYTRLNGATGGDFDDEHYSYTDPLTFLTSCSGQSYSYSDRKKYYKKINDIYVNANLGRQWNDGTYFIASIDSTTGNKTFTQATEYDATATYYVYEDSQYIMVNVGNEYTSSSSASYYKLNNNFASVYEKKYYKFLTFHTSTGRENYAGFKYGINLKGITRQLDSSTMATKVIVAANANEYATGGTCSIQDAVQNSSGSNTIYNFSYYIKKKLVDENQLNRDLYGDASGGMKYITKTAQISNDTKEKTVTLSSAMTTYSKVLANKTILEQKIAAAKEAREEAESELVSLGKSKDAAYSASNSSAVNEIIQKRDNAIAIIATESQVTVAKQEANRIKLQINDINNRLKSNSEHQKALDYEFYTKYSRFITEGTWSSEDAFDPDQYYYDACRVSRVSAFPQIKYTINVADVSELDEYKYYDFAVGDITQVRDTDFFSDQGVQSIDVIVNEVKYNLSDPTKNTITVVNYLTRFEDLFQRVAASAQTLQYNEGSYDRAANSIDGDVINSTLLNRTLDNNDAIISNAGAQNVTWDENGITVSDNSLINKLRIVGNGIVISDDAGATWKTGLSTDGINANAITTGTIDADKINIYGGTSGKLFSWDKYGINAYSNGYTSGQVSHDQFVRFDANGIYGVRGVDATTEPATLLNNAMFSLTWNGLSLKSTTAGSGYLKLNANGLGSVTGQGTKIITAGTTSGSTSTDNFYVTDTGYLYATNAKIDGEVEMTSLKLNGVAVTSGGQISGSYINAKGISVTNSSSQTTFNVDSNGNVSIAGTVTMGSNSSINWANVTESNLSSNEGYAKATTAQSTANNAQATANAASQTASSAASDAASAINNLKKVLNGQKVTGFTGTFIDEGCIYSPNIFGNVIGVYGKNATHSGTFAIYLNNGDQEPTLRGFLGYAKGSTGGTDTEGIAMVCTEDGQASNIGGKPQFIATNGGVRMSMNDTALYLNNSQIQYKINGGDWHDIGVAVFG